MDTKQQILDIRKVCGYDFIKMASFYNDKPIEATFNGKKLDNYTLAIHFINDEFLKAEQSTYLVFENDELIYAGYYSTSFEDRWIKKQSGIYYCWHSENIDNYIKNSQSIDKFSIWITLNPYAKTDDGKIVNISKVIEDTIISNIKPSRNKVGKTLKENQKNTKSAKEILKSI